MTDEQNQPGAEEGSAENTKPDELSMLKARARMMGITFSNNISVETLKGKIQDHLAGEESGEGKTDDLEELPETDPVVEPTAPTVGAYPQITALPQPNKAQAPAPLVDPAAPKLLTKRGKLMSLREQIRKENLRLIRVRVTNMDPKKKDLPGEFITVANEYLGTVRKFVPFTEQEDGYHIPYCIYKQLIAKKFLNIRTYKDKRNNNEIKIEQTWAKEFNIEVLPQLTPVELRQLALAQAAAGGVS